MATIDRYAYFNTLCFTHTNTNTHTHTHTNIHTKTHTERDRDLAPVLKKFSIYSPSSGLHFCVSFISSTH